MLVLDDELFESDVYSGIWGQVSLRLKLKSATPSSAFLICF
ncbi:hypothetical protein imdm_1793 [gamma proteobacterium IMCC2047]|nr:hypothetical protein imdm_1793 [gamma proteobacterium IMCC2047]